MAQFRQRVCGHDVKLSHNGDSLGAGSTTQQTTQKEPIMIWKLLGLQKKLDALFDDGWVNLGLPTAREAKA